MAGRSISLCAALSCFVLAACSAPNAAENQAAQASPEAKAPAKPFVPLTSAEIKKLLSGHYIDEGPYGCFDGPLRVLGDGSFEAYNIGSGVTGGTVEIVDGAAIFDDGAGPEHFRRVLMLFRDGRGDPFYRAEGDTADPRPLRLGRNGVDEPVSSCQPGNASG
ncbi:hypothetical protein P1X14_01270 [Sphingomonas sp. AOB5]|uniref:hypothetical protein n=1 Tax=Sphingomonas sp. AOB5 TaxID=3034017 RepID=UPI0023F78282|nr:hypothetical protein [Sphingomonas sp. AOB5]MDF7773861.1 hypothetical protein [Sphingomonas sp. AOB5]